MSLSHKREPYKTRRNRARRPKTFKSEETAKKYAETQGIKSYKLVDLKHGLSKKKKIKVVETG